MLPRTASNVRVLPRQLPRTSWASLLAQNSVLACTTVLLLVIGASSLTLYGRIEPDQGGPGLAAPGDAADLVQRAQRLAAAAATEAQALRGAASLVDDLASELAAALVVQQAGGTAGQLSERQMGGDGGEGEGGGAHLSLRERLHRDKAESADSGAAGAASGTTAQLAAALDRAATTGASDNDDTLNGGAGEVAAYGAGAAGVALLRERISEAVAAATRRTQEQAAGDAGGGDGGSTSLLPGDGGEEAAGGAASMGDMRTTLSDVLSRLGALRAARSGSDAPAGEGTSAGALPGLGRPEPAVAPLSEEELARRRGAVRGAARHAWDSYVQYAWGNDELCPLTRRGQDSFGGLGATIIDSLDTLLLMGMREEYDRALRWVASDFDPPSKDFEASVFETVIRVVGGFLAAYDVTGDAVLLDRSRELADRLMGAYNTSTGIPYNTINLKTLAVSNPKWNLKASTLAEFGTHQMELYRLSRLTGKQDYTRAAEASIAFLHDAYPRQGVMPLFISPETGRFTSRKASLGALGDSYYEYLLKTWLLKGKRDDVYREMWEQAMDDMLARLVFTSRAGLQYVAEFDRSTVKHKMDHLACFVPGMLALGAMTHAVQGAKAQRYLDVAGNLSHTCWQMYRSTPSGLSPEYVQFSSAGMRSGAHYYLQRPEAVEAFWYMWRATGDWRYRAWGWEVFTAIETHCRTEGGYAGVKDVRSPPPLTLDDTQQSFFLAETLKYLYLLFSDDDAFHFDDWVLNTEAHALRVDPPTHRAAGGKRQGKRPPGGAAEQDPAAIWR